MYTKDKIILGKIDEINSKKLIRRKMLMKNIVIFINDSKII